jgi:putative acetyltransferase
VVGPVVRTPGDRLSWLTPGTIEALFIDPDHRLKGAGSFLVDHAQRLSRSTLVVEVNTQNKDAVSFYRAQGFVVVGLSPVDSGGRPFPLFQMKRVAA